MRINPSYEADDLEEIGPLEEKILAEEWCIIMNMLEHKDTVILITEDFSFMLEVKTGFGKVVIKTMELYDEDENDT